MAPDLSIVKIEGQKHDDTGGLDMYVDTPGDGSMMIQGRSLSGAGNAERDEALEEWAQEQFEGNESGLDPDEAKGKDLFIMLHLAEVQGIHLVLWNSISIHLTTQIFST